jgi:amidophosphoribosyltransferase
VEEIHERLGADSLAYLSLDHLLEAVGGAGAEAGYCHACLTGSYPTAVPVTVGAGRA